MKHKLFIALALLMAVTMQAQLNGKFSVSASQHVQFSTGNLRYHCTNHTWSFASNQYDVIGSSNRNVSSTYSGYIDLFGWGTSGYNNCMPYETSLSVTYGGGGSSIAGTNYDWGVYGMSGYRTLTQSEWSYLFNGRSNASSLRAPAKVNNVCGWILLPDSWNSSSSSISFTSSANGANSYNSNVYSASDFSVMQSAGAVFLPAAGYRYSSGAVSTVSGVNSMGYYWSANNANVSFMGNYLYCASEMESYMGLAVRLVKNSGSNSGSSKVSISVLASPTDGANTYGSGLQEIGSTVTIGVTLKEGFSFMYWQDGNTDNPRTITVTEAATYTAYLSRPDGKYKVTTRVGNGRGTVTGAGWYDLNSYAYLSATPAAGYVFDKWQDGYTSSSRSYKVIGDATFTANFRMASNVTLHLSCDSTIGEVAIGVGNEKDGVQWVARGSDISYSCKENDTLYTKVLLKDRTYYYYWRAASQGGNTPNRYNSNVEEGSQYFIINQDYDIYPEFHKKVNQYTVTTIDDPNGKVTFRGGGTYWEYDTIYVYVDRSCTVQNLKLNVTTSYTSTISVNDDIRQNRGLNPNLVAKYLITSDKTFSVKSYTERGAWFDVVSNDTTMGTIVGDGPYCDGEMVQAIPKPGYVFLGWTSPYFKSSVGTVITNPIPKEAGSLEESLLSYLESGVVSKTTITHIPVTAQFAPLAVVASGYCGIPDAAAQYVFTNDGTLTITGAGPLKEIADVDSVLYWLGSGKSGETLKRYFRQTIPWLQNDNIPVRKIIVSEGITSIGSAYFAYCNPIETSFPTTITDVAPGAFFNSSGMDVSPFVENLTSIPPYAFRACRFINSDTLYINADTIHSNAFLTSGGYLYLVIGADVKYIGRDAFSYAYNVTDVVFLNTASLNLGGSTNNAFVGGTLSANAHHRGNITGYYYAKYGLLKTAYRYQKVIPYHMDGSGQVKVLYNPIFRYNQDTAYVLGNQRVEFSVEPDLGYKLIGISMYNGYDDCKVGVEGEATAIYDGDLPEQYQSANKQNFWIESAQGNYTGVEDLELTLTYEALPFYTISGTAIPTGSGSISGLGNYPLGYELTITAVPNAGYRFVQWEDGNTDNPRTITITGDDHYYATFEKYKDYTPTGLIASQEDSTVWLDWNAVDDVLYYQWEYLYEGEYLNGDITTELYGGVIFYNWEAGSYPLVCRVRSLDDTKQPISDWASVDFTLVITTEGIEDIVVTPSDETRKLLINGTLYILLPDGAIYDAQGMRVK